ncbi:hypothetical protein SPRG_08186 [Saprolegnia parasitica CBS 223.65]|uniref:Major facilitator superfamily (MFS) profile domain-containing protein n=1 Tax=Saprolegnia parasitica (strain CBS 223.65) TaxID=695850 RepID=A0A067C7A1_SAPPC|nr:hypothetical protein SPRG_08186 [Saprolegnia parasitica CBS 223.65]KDO26383.1 hypothetical protein SPRG_08186 [Saprolegnia parasitica CBS 223.65]|eukprot:XP_012202821.1 hypothetical protein SPRG_08186 [Saprolegnia parasitica CBS 223.65]
MRGGCAYWTIIVPPKSPAEEAAEVYLLVLPRGTDVYWTSRPIRFRRWHLFFAVFCVQVVSGSMYAVTTGLAPALDLHFYGSATANKVVHALYVACTAMGLAAALSGPALERRGPRWGITLGACGVGLGCALLQIAILATSRAILYAGALFAGAGFGIVMLCSTATAQKWCPDIRGVVTGLNCFAWGIGGAVFDIFFRRVVASSADGLSFVIWFYLAIVLPILVLAALVLRTPPPSFQVHGKTMHSIPAASAPSPTKIQDEFLNVGMTLVNYDIVRRSSNTTSGNDQLLEGTDRRYYEQVKALSLLQCIFSTDFVLLYVAFGATATAGLITIELRIPGDEVGNLKSWYPALSDHEARTFLITGLLINWVGRLLYPMVSDVLIRVLYANPAAARKVCFWLLVLAQAIALGVGLNSPQLESDFYVFSHTNYVLRFATGGGASTIICLLTDMYGVYNVGTMYGLIITSWSIGMVIVGMSFAGEKHVFLRQLDALWVLAIAGSVFMIFVRTNSKDRFYRGYQLTIWNKVWIQWPILVTSIHILQRDDDDDYHDMVLLSPDAGSSFMWSSESEMDAPHRSTARVQTV